MKHADVHTDNKETLVNALARIEELEQKLEEAKEEELRFLNMLMPYIHPSSTCEVYKSVCKRKEQLKEASGE